MPGAPYFRSQLDTLDKYSETTFNTKIIIADEGILWNVKRLSRIKIFVALQQNVRQRNNENINCIW